MTAPTNFTAPAPIQVSIIIPCYNGSRFLQSTLESAAGQSRAALEILVIDDGSTDDSAAIAERFGSPVRVIRQSNQGESAARNRGMREAKGTHVLFLDADDLLAVDSLKQLTAALEGRPHAIALMGCAFFSSDPDSHELVKNMEFDHFYPDIIESNFGPPLGWLVPIDLVRRAGGFCETLRWFEDWDLWWRVGLDEPELIPVPYIGARYRQHAQSQLSTTSPANRARGHAALMERMTDAFLARPTLLAKYGDRVFWCAWTAVKRARAAGVPWSELSGLCRGLGALAARGPRTLSRSYTGRAVRLLGARTVASLR